jgi:hypothetical protein
MGAETYNQIRGGFLSYQTFEVTVVLKFKVQSKRKQKLLR